MGGSICASRSFESQLALDQQSARSATRIVDLLALPRAEHVRHEPADFFGREELASALALALGELPEQVFVGAPEEVRLHVLQAEAVAGIGSAFR